MTGFSLGSTLTADTVWWWVYIKRLLIIMDDVTSRESPLAVWHIDRNYHESSSVRRHVYSGNVVTWLPSTRPLKPMQRKQLKTVECVLTQLTQARKARSQVSNGRSGRSRRKWHNGQYARIETAFILALDENYGWINAGSSRNYNEKLFWCIAVASTLCPKKTSPTFSTVSWKPIIKF